MMARLAATLVQIGELLGCEVRPGVREREIARVSGIAAAGPDTLVFAMDDEALAEALGSGAGGILAPAGCAGDDDRLLRVKNPRTAFGVVYARWFDERGSGGVDGTAIVEEGARPGCSAVD